MGGYRVVSINEVNLHRARLVLGRVNLSGVQTLDKYLTVSKNKKKE